MSSMDFCWFFSLKITRLYRWQRTPLFGDYAMLRHIVERAFWHLKRWRGMATQYAKNTVSFLASVHIRYIAIWADGYTILIQEGNAYTLWICVCDREKSSLSRRSIEKTDRLFANAISNRPIKKRLIFFG
jgi:hypothetical protein